MITFVMQKNNAKNKYTFLYVFRMAHLILHGHNFAPKPKLGTFDKKATPDIALCGDIVPAVAA